MRDDFCVFILSHGRPDKVYTYRAIIRSGYSGKIFIVIDDEDKFAEEYRKKYGDIVLQFCKREYAEKLDEGDNSGKRISTIYARAAMFDLAPKVGCKKFIQLDDDYTSFFIRFKSDGQYCAVRVKKTMDEVLQCLCDFYDSCNATSVSMAQGGDFLGGQQIYDGKLSGNFASLRRKCMNSFICSIDRPWTMFGRMNEDVNTYVTQSRKGHLFFTVMQAQLTQKTTQQNNGGMSGIYLELGTYVKTFYSVMYAPSCVKVGVMGDHRSHNYRIHHKINWNVTSPKILRENKKRISNKNNLIAAV